MGEDIRLNLEVELREREREREKCGKKIFVVTLFGQMEYSWLK